MENNTDNSNNPAETQTEIVTSNITFAANALKDIEKQILRAIAAGLRETCWVGYTEKLVYALEHILNAAGFETQRSQKSCAYGYRDIGFYIDEDGDADVDEDGNTRSYCSIDYKYFLVITLPVETPKALAA